jgi:hypothetical protein
MNYLEQLLYEMLADNPTGDVIKTKDNSYRFHSSIGYFRYRLPRKLKMNGKYEIITQLVYVDDHIDENEFLEYRQRDMRINFHALEIVI